MKTDHLKRTLGLAFAFLFAAPLFADTLGIDFTSSKEKFKGLVVVGWTFDIDADYVGTALGYYDATPENSPVVHAVGIFDSLANLIVSVVVATDDPLISHWRWHSVGFTLPAGTGYVIVAATQLDDSAKEADGFTADPFLTITGHASSSTGTGLDFPTTFAPAASPDDIFLAPNMVRADATSTVPEPGTWMLLATGAVGIRLIRRRP